MKSQLSSRPLLLLATLAIAAGAMSAAACGGTDLEEEGLQVVSTTAIIGALAKEVGGDKAGYHVLIDPGVDPHDFEPVASDLRQVGVADVVLRNGIGLDDFLDDTLEGAGGDATVVTVTEGVEVYEGAGKGDGDEHGDGEGGDPHVWHDPANVKVMVANIAEAMATADPENAATYRSRATAYAAKLDEVDAEIEALIAAIPAENRKMVTNHDAFGYFLRRYGLEFVGAVIPGTSTAAEPSAEDLAELIDAIEAAGVPVIFSESAVDPRVAEQLADDAGIGVVDDLYSDTLGEPGSGAETVDGMLLSNATKISEALR